MVTSLCDVCNNATKFYRLFKTWKVCFECQIPTEPKSVTMQQKKIGTMVVRHGDRFLWNSFKWFVIDFLEEDCEIVVRLEGTGDVATLPETLVAELVEEFMYIGTIWR